MSEEILNDSFEDIEYPKKKENNKVGKKVETYTQSEEIFLMFKENRKFELHIGRNMWTFNGRVRLKVPKSILYHKDWTNETEKKFVVSEVV